MNNILEFSEIIETKEKIDLDKLIDDDIKEYNIDIERADRHDAILMGFREDDRNEFDKKRDEIEYKKNQLRIDNLCNEILKGLGKD